MMSDSNLHSLDAEEPICESIGHDHWLQSKYGSLLPYAHSPSRSSPPCERRPLPMFDAIWVLWKLLQHSNVFRYTGTVLNWRLDYTDVLPLLVSLQDPVELSYQPNWRRWPSAFANGWDCTRSRAVVEKPVDQTWISNSTNYMFFCLLLK